MDQGKKLCLERIVAPHIDSFNSITKDGLLDMAVKNIDARVLVDSQGNKFGFWLEDVQIGKPMLSERNKYGVTRLIYPSECRERRITYEGSVLGRICYQKNRESVMTTTKSFGKVPVMVKSNLCNLEGASKEKMTSRHEDSDDPGGYFVVNGIEKIIRMLIATRRNYPIGIIRPSYKQKAPLFSQYGVMMRSVRDDQTSQTITLHYLVDESARMRFSWRREEYIVPLVLILRCLRETTDREMYEAIVQNEWENTIFVERIGMMIAEFHRYKLFTSAQCIEYLGSKFRRAFSQNETLTDEQVGVRVLQNIVLVHLDSFVDKFYMLVFMIRKLYKLVGGEICSDNEDSVMNHEIMMSGHVYNGLVKDKLDEMLTLLRIHVTKHIQKRGSLDDIEKVFPELVNRVGSNVGSRIQYFLATGNLGSMSGMNVQQHSGYTLMAERLNFHRHVSHFQSVHRGAFFVDLKTTTVRKLLPETWGFLCPVNTPDGTLCGLLNHLAHQCQVVTTIRPGNDLEMFLAKSGMLCHVGGMSIPASYLAVIVDGRIVGYCSEDDGKKIEKMLRRKKVEDEVFRDVEVGLVDRSRGGLCPGLYIFCGPARMMRAVIQIRSGKEEMVGSFEQVFLDIAVKKEDVCGGVSTHFEDEPTNMLSVVANMTPFSNFNQSPRNMYQCQMAKQSLGMSVYNFPHRWDNSMYRLDSGQKPIVRTRFQAEYGLDKYPSGVEAVVAVISYTGYDMEDALILNKSSDERGFSHATMYKTEICELHDRTKPDEVTSFGCMDTRVLDRGQLDQDGFPSIGQKIRSGDPLFGVYNAVTGKTKLRRYKGMEEACVDGISLLGNDVGTGPSERAVIKLRISRNPIIGDKYSSRHGQKGICSQKWQAVDIPFSESGIIPDIIINPHAFPSRMTVGMLIESLGGKAGALHGRLQDATPFGSRENVVDYFGSQLRDAGYNYYGNETMYSGMFGVEMKMDIYVGIVHYQRLKHMVSDKFQVRTTGPVHNLTHQPVKGRQNEGGIRFGEMERDSLLAHGTSFLLQDRLMNCSDYTKMPLCIRCGGLMGIQEIRRGDASEIRCRECGDAGQVRTVALPYVFRYLAAELMAMNVRTTIRVA